MTNSTSVTSVLGKLPSPVHFFWQATKIAPIALIWYLVGWSLWNTGTVVEPIGIPKRIEEMGFSSTGLASSLAAEIREIQESDGRKKYRQEIKAAEKQQDIQVPGLPIPLHSALEMVRKAVGRQEQRISSEIIEEDGRLVLLLDGGRAEPVSSPIGNDRGLAMRTLIQKGAQEAMSTTDCAALAKWSYLTARAGSGQFGETRRIIGRCLKNSAQDGDHATSIRLHMVLALVNAAQGNPEGAERQFRLALEISDRVKGADPAGELPIRSASGDVHGQPIMHMSYNLVPVTISAVSKDPLRASVLLNEGLTLNQAGHPERALKALAKAASFDGGSVEVASALGNVYRTLTTVKRKEGDDAAAEKNLQLAEAQFTRARNLDPTYADTFFNWANLLADNNRCQEALKHFQRAAELRPLDLETYSNWARTLANMGDYDQALKLIEIALSGSPAQASKGPPLAYAYSNKGAILDLRLRAQATNLDQDQRRKTLQQEAEAYWASVEAFPEYPEARYHLARVSRELDLTEQANRQFGIYKALSAKPQQEPTEEGKSSQPSAYEWESVRYCPSQNISLAKTFHHYENIDPHHLQMTLPSQSEQAASTGL
jgi:tetratricopeptide (TPR) repeat protein